jgi:hypothetical protein
MGGLSTIYQSHSTIDSATATAELIERDVIGEIEVDDTIEVDIS